MNEIHSYLWNSVMILAIYAEYMECYVNIFYRSSARDFIAVIGIKTRVARNYLKSTVQNWYVKNYFWISTWISRDEPKAFCQYSNLCNTIKILKVLHVRNSSRKNATSWTILVEIDFDWTFHSIPINNSLTR